MSSVDPSTLRARLDEFVRYRQNLLTGDERGEAQVFLDRLFRAFGHGGVREAGAVLESRIRSGTSRAVSFADLMWKPRCLIEMKRAGENLGRHYQQAFNYWVHAVPDRPRYVILCNFDEIWTYDFNHQLDEPLDRMRLSDLPRRWEALAFLMVDPMSPRFGNDLVSVTRESADRMATLFQSLVGRGVNRDTAQRFTLQAVMAAFAEDIGLLPSHYFSRAVDDCVSGGRSSYDEIFGLFREMNSPGLTPAGRFRGTPYFNGGLFRTIEPVDLTSDELTHLQRALETNWADVRPEIFGTLFERSMDAESRHAFGAHFTNPVDIAKIVQPTIVRPWREMIEVASGSIADLERLLSQLAKFKVLDPACGAGNFLYVAYRELKRLEQEINQAIIGRRRGGRREDAYLSLVSPHQFFGLDINGFAVELAKITLQIAKKLAVDELDIPTEQVLPLDDLDSNFRVCDALFDPWPETDVIIGNPPFLGRRNLVDERGAVYAAQLDAQYPGVSGVSDYCVYWFRNAHDRLKMGGRAGHVGTNTIRQGGTRQSGLDYILSNGGIITDAVSSQVWSGEANVHVSIVNWTKGPVQGPHRLWVSNGSLLLELDRIPSSLSAAVDVSHAATLRANRARKLCFQGQTPGHAAFLVTPEFAATLNASASRPVAFPSMGGREMLYFGRVRRFIVDLDAGDSAVASAVAPDAYRYLRELVLPDREARAAEEESRNAEVLAHNPAARVNRHHAAFLSRWWQLSYRRGDLLQAIGALSRFIALTRTSGDERWPVFEFLDSSIRPIDTLVAFALDDDYSFGVLQSKIHREWFRARCTTLKADPNYTNTTVWNSFPWPQEPSESQVQSVVRAAERVLEAREVLRRQGLTLAQMYDTLRSPGRSELRAAHESLDAAVVDAYQFDRDEDVLAQLLALNLSMAAQEEDGVQGRGPGPSDFPNVRRTTYRIVP